MRKKSCRRGSRRKAVLAGLLVVLAVAGCAGGPVPGQAAGTGAVNRGASVPLPLPTGCTVRVIDRTGLQRALAEAGPGVRVCVTGQLDSTRLVITRSGARGRPLEVLGDGTTTVGGITVAADEVSVRGFTVVGGDAPGIRVRGRGITIADNTVRHPTGGDYDGIWFFGSDLTIRHNTLLDIATDDGSPSSGDCVQTNDVSAVIPDPAGLVVRPAKATGECELTPDCLQSFATGPDAPEPNSGTSHHVVIDGNRCLRAEGHCLLVQGPDSGVGSGSGTGDSAGITFTNNECDAHASSAVRVDNVKDITITDNQIDSTELGGDKGVLDAFSLVNGSDGATIAGNHIDPSIIHLVELDDSSRPGYRGPAPEIQP